MRFAIPPGLKLVWDGNSYLEVSVPPLYKEQLCGLCGNYNHDDSDDLSQIPQAAETVLQTPPSIYQFGMAWATGGHKRCRLKQDETYLRRFRRKMRRKARRRHRKRKHGALKLPQGALDQKTIVDLVRKMERRKMTKSDTSRRRSFLELIRSKGVRGLPSGRRSVISSGETSPSRPEIDLQALRSRLWRESIARQNAVNFETSPSRPKTVERSRTDNDLSKTQKTSRRRSFLDSIRNAQPQVRHAKNCLWDKKGKAQRHCRLLRSQVFSLCHPRVSVGLFYK